VVGDRSAGPLRVLQGRGAEVDAGAPGGQGGGEAAVVADAAAELDLDVEPPDDVREQGGVRTAPEGGVEINEMDPLGTGLLPGARRLERVAVSVPAAPCTSLTAWPPATSTAGSSCSRGADTSSSGGRRRGSRWTPAG
jgi:hypothetical protein